VYTHHAHVCGSHGAMIDVGPPVQVVEGELEGHVSTRAALRNVVPGSAAVFTGDNTVHLVLGTTLGVAIAACVGILLVVLWLMFICATRAAEAASRSRYTRSRAKEQSEYEEQHESSGRGWAARPRRQNAQSVTSNHYVVTTRGNSNAAVMEVQYVDGDGGNDENYSVHGSWLERLCFCGTGGRSSKLKQQGVGVYGVDNEEDFMSGPSQGFYHQHTPRRFIDREGGGNSECCYGLAWRLCTCGCGRGDAPAFVHNSYEDGNFGFA
jgi:hypothetical protein